MLETDFNSLIQHLPGLISNQIRKLSDGSGSLQDQICYLLEKLPQKSASVFAAHLTADHLALAAANLSLGRLALLLTACPPDKKRIWADQIIAGRLHRALSGVPAKHLSAALHGLPVIVVGRYLGANPALLKNWTQPFLIEVLNSPQITPAVTAPLLKQLNTPKLCSLLSALGCVKGSRILSALPEPLRDQILVKLSRSRRWNDHLLKSPPALRAKFTLYTKIPAAALADKIRRQIKTLSFPRDHEKIWLLRLKHSNQNMDHYLSELFEPLSKTAEPAFSESNWNIFLKRFCRLPSEKFVLSHPSILKCRNLAELRIEFIKVINSSDHSMQARLIKFKRFLSAPAAPEGLYCQPASDPSMIFKALISGDCSAPVSEAHLLHPSCLQWKIILNNKWRGYVQCFTAVNSRKRRALILDAVNLSGRIPLRHGDFWRRLVSGLAGYCSENGIEVLLAAADSRARVTNRIDLSRAYLKLFSRATAVSDYTSRPSGLFQSAGISYWALWKSTNF